MNLIYEGWDLLTSFGIQYIINIHISFGFNKKEMWILFMYWIPNEVKRSRPS